MLNSDGAQPEHYVTPNQTVTLSVCNHVATITLNRPDRYNSFVDEMHDDLRAAIKIVENLSGLRCLVLTGSGKAFCTGQDLKSRYELVQQGAPDLGKSLAKNYNPLIQRLQNLPVPVICALNGVAAGAGVSLALACDIVVAANSASLVLAFAKVGLVPDAGCTWSLVQALGFARARALCLLGDTISAADAESWGLVYQTVAAESLVDATQEIIDRLLENPARGQALTKRAMLSAAATDLPAQLQTEAQLQTVAGRTQDYSEAVKAFVEKRKPSFSGT